MTIEEREKYSLLFDKYQNLLSQTQKQAMHLYLIEDLSLQEIANIMATTRQATNDAISKGKKKLNKINDSII